MLSANRKKIALRVIIINLGALIIGVTYGIIGDYIYINGLPYADCIFKEILHFYCPGCGGTRSVIALIHFDFLKSFFYYPPILICVLIIIIMDFFDIYAFIKDVKTKFNFNLFYIIVALIIIQFFVRNVLLLFGIDTVGDIF